MCYNKFTRHEQICLIRLRFEGEKYLNTEQTSKNIVL